MIADLVVTLVVYRAGGGFLAACPEFGIEAMGASPGDAREEALVAVRRLLDAAAVRGELASLLADVGFVVDGGVLRAERRPVDLSEGRVLVQL